MPIDEPFCDCTKDERMNANISREGYCTHCDKMVRTPQVHDPLPAGDRMSILKQRIQEMELAAGNLQDALEQTYYTLEEYITSWREE